nr:unnamed protein product [Digitaria exilis]
MDDGGIQEEPPTSARFLTPTRSGGSRWVDGSEVDSSESAGWSLGAGDERSAGAVLTEASAAPASRVSSGTFRRRLGKRPRRVDSLDVEAMNVRGAHGHSSKVRPRIQALGELSMLSTIAMAFQTLGVVYGDMGTSPLYVFSDVFSKVPIKSEVEILGALSLVMYTIALIPFAKYVFIVLKANDNGEGGTFALYSLICRLPRKEAPLQEHSPVLGSDGDFHVMSAVSGLQGQVPGFDTGAEAMFADLGHFSVKSIQVAFTAVVFPCLLIAYMGQAAFLMKNPLAAERIFYDSVPGVLFWPVFVIATLAAMIASQAMISATFSCIKQAMALGCFPRIKIIHTSKKVMGQIYIPVMNWFLMVMCIIIVATFRSTNDIANAYGIAEVGVMMSEMRGKISLDFILDLGATLGTVRVPGIGLVYNELVQGIPSIFGQLLVTLPAMHSTIVFVCIKYVPVPYVPLEERFLFRRVGQKDYHMFRCVARYGYKDVRKEDHGFFEQLLVESLEKFLRTEAQEIALEASTMEAERDDVSVISEVPQSPACEGDLQTPLLSDQRSGDDNRIGSRDGAPVLPASSMSAEEDPALEYELEALREAMASGFTYLLAHGDVRARKESFFTKKFIINYFYAFLRRNCRAGTAILKVPHSNIMRVGMTYMV